MMPVIGLLWIKSQCLFSLIEGPAGYSAGPFFYRIIPIMYRAGPALFLEAAGFSLINRCHLTGKIILTPAGFLQVVIFKGGGFFMAIYWQSFRASIECLSEYFRTDRKVFIATRFGRFHVPVSELTADGGRLEVDEAIRKIAENINRKI